MREVPVSNCERNFIQRGFLNERRTDGRTCGDYRKLRISLGIDRGSCLVELGNTKALAQVSCSLVVPKEGRPHEGFVHVSLDMSPMASPSYEAGRLGDNGIEIIRMIERCVKESRCLDCESLCLIAGKRVRVDIHVLDNDGSVADCCSIAAITALLHFRKPDATVIGEDFVLHPVEEKNPIPLNIFHLPMTVTFGVLERGTCLFVDPTELEEKMVEGKIIVGANSHREICALHCSGNILIKKPQILRCSNMAVSRAVEVTGLIRQALANDTEARIKGEKCGFAELIQTTSITGHSLPETPVQMADVTETHAEMTQLNRNDTEVISVRGKVVQLGDGQSRLMSESDVEVETNTSNLKNQLLKEEDDVEIVREIQRSARRVSIKAENEENQHVNNAETTEEVVIVKETKKPKKVKKPTTKMVDQDMEDLLNEMEQDAITIGLSDIGMTDQKTGIASAEPVETKGAKKSEKKKKKTAKAS